MKEILPVLYLYPLRRLFFYFFSIFLCVGLLGFIYRNVYGQVAPGNFTTTAIQPFLVTLPFLVLFLLTMTCLYFLKRINEAEDPDIIVEKYTRFYKNRLAGYTMSVVVTAVLYMLTIKNIYPCIYLFQTVLVFSFYPSGRLINRDLKGRPFIVL